MKSSQSEIEGHTFTRSPEGIRSERIGLWGSSLVITIGTPLVILLPELLAGRDAEAWREALFPAILGTFPVVLLYLLLGHYLPPARWESGFRVEGEYVVVAPGVHSRRISLSELKGIRIERGTNGKNRTVTLRDATGVVCRLVGPTEGDLLERWAVEEAARHGIPVTVRASFLLSFEPYSTPVLIAAAMLVVGLIVSKVYWAGHL